MKGKRKAFKTTNLLSLISVGIWLFICVDSSAWASGPGWLDRDGNPLPFDRDEEVLEFLRTARVVKSRDVSTGINKIKKVLLEKDGVQCHAAFRCVCVDKNKMEMEDGSIQFNFRDDFIFEVAAYELGRLLGLNNIPPVVKRKLDRRMGSLQLWVEKAVTEGKRIKERQRPPDCRRWHRQTQLMRIFDNLVYNEDRNPGNILYDSTWKMWLIDHTRAFRRYNQLKNSEGFTQCERGLWERLQTLTREDFKDRLGPLVHPAELNGMLKRRDLIVARIQELIDINGEENVIFEFKRQGNAVGEVGK